MATQTVTSQTSLPDDLMAQYRYLLDEANAVYQGTPYTPYPYARVAGLTPDQLAAMEGVRGAQGIWRPYMDEAAGSARGIGSLAMSEAQRYAGGQGVPYDRVTAPTIASQVIGAAQFPGADIARYMNPYESLVTQQSIRALEDAAARQQASADARFASSGAFGGSRQGLYDANLGSQVARGAGELANTSRMQNYGNAQQMWTADANRLLQADVSNQTTGLTAAQANQNAMLRAAQGNQSAGLQAQQLGISALGQLLQTGLGAGTLMGNLGSAASTNAYRDTASLMGIGELQRGLDQSNLNTAYGDFKEQRDYPWTQLERLTGIVNGSPLSRATTQTQTSPGPSTWAQLLGAGLGLSGILGNTGAFGKNGWLTGSGVGGISGGDGGLDSFGIGSGSGFEDSLIDSGGGVDLFGLGDYGAGFDWTYGGIPLI